MPVRNCGRKNQRNGCSGIGKSVAGNYEKRAQCSGKLRGGYRFCVGTFKYLDLRKGTVVYQSDSLFCVIKMDKEYFV